MACLAVTTIALSREISGQLLNLLESNDGNDDSSFSVPGDVVCGELGAGGGVVQLVVHRRGLARHFEHLRHPARKPSQLPIFAQLNLLSILCNSTPRLSLTYL